MSGFIQIIEYKTNRPDEVRELGEKFNANRAFDSSDAPRVIVGADRDQKGVYRTIVEFPSYEIAMANSNRPDTTEFATKMASLCEGAPKFYNMDKVHEM